MVGKSLLDTRDSVRHCATCSPSKLSAGEHAVREFGQHELGGAAMLLSKSAGGCGLNLTAANHLLIVEPAWNPASDAPQRHLFHMF